MSLLVDFCDHQAAKHAVTKWHYSRTLPLGRVVKVGVWEYNQFIGAVLFARGASPNYGHRFAIDTTEVCELVRVALTRHEAPVTQIVAQAIGKLKRSSPGIRVVVSFADQRQGHLGTIYQAGNWTYLGTTAEKSEYLYHGKWTHDRIINGPPNWLENNPDRALPEIVSGMSYAELKASLPKRIASVKFRYAYPLDKKMRRVLNTMALPYPTADDLAAQVSEARHRASGSEGQVRSLGAAPDNLMEGTTP